MKYLAGEVKITVEEKYKMFSRLENVDWKGIQKVAWKVKKWMQNDNHEEDVT